MHQNRVNLSIKILTEVYAFKYFFGNQGLKIAVFPNINDSQYMYLTFE